MSTLPAACPRPKINVPRIKCACSIGMVKKCSALHPLYLEGKYFAKIPGGYIYG